MAINAFDRTGFQDHAAANQALAEFLKEFDPIKPAGLRMWRHQVVEPTFVPSLELKQPLRQIFEGFYPPAGSKLGGRAADAVRSHERSLQLNPNNANAKKMLETLRRSGR